MALYGYVLYDSVGIRADKQRGEQLLLQSKHVTARVYRFVYGIDMDEDEEDEEEVYRLLVTECDESDPHVLYLLGWCYHNGDGCNVDTAQAILLYEEAGNHIEALSGLADLLFEEEDGEEEDGALSDRYRAIALYRQAAKQGYARAQCILGYSYEFGIYDVLEKDIAQAKHWYLLAAEQGNGDAAAGLERLKT
eukprot:TRINITY_DN7235_c0_g1_i1.p1 TRINITY_DN7235_c0_g1~~TRINITY_DN7235_c0_g1_i1.p1  ORF type:complete len:214 (-),score=65.88 TRINITY_DN7235_c0_g1_i1:75-653(-)